MNRLLLCLFLLFTGLQGHAAVDKYVAPEAMGSASGSSRDAAADFLDQKFWQQVQTLLQQEDVTVHFLPGNYVRAFTTRPLLLSDLGHDKHVLVLEGEASKTIFTAPTGHADKAVLMELKNARNVVVRNLSFTGNGRLGYAFRITSTEGKGSQNILVENCSWQDMRGIIYGATGCHKPGTNGVTFRNCVFKRIGIDSHSHHMYNAHGARNIVVQDSHFEDCTGDYVRFRDNCDFITVKNSTFLRNQEFPEYPFISMPLFNNVEPGDEQFASNFTLSGNTFSNAKYAIAFHHYGFTHPGFNFLLSAEQGQLLQNGSPQEKKKILKQSFGIDAAKVSISKNTYHNVKTKVGMGTFARYGAKSKGFEGWGDISPLF
ncbi:MAG: right-handed parallel beta-helix repeat-containing protein [Adhaeribacter sp.]